MSRQFFRNVSTCANHNYTYLVCSQFFKKRGFITINKENFVKLMEKIMLVKKMKILRVLFLKTNLISHVKEF